MDQVDYTSLPNYTVKYNFIILKRVKQFLLLFFRKGIRLTVHRLVLKKPTVRSLSDI